MHKLNNSNRQHFNQIRVNPYRVHVQLPQLIQVTQKGFHFIFLRERNKYVSIWKNNQTKPINIYLYFYESIKMQTYITVKTLLTRVAVRISQYVTKSGHQRIQLDIYTEEQVIITRLLGKEINLLIVRMNLDHAMLIVIDEVV